MTSITQLDVRDFPWWPWPWRLLVYLMLTVTVLGATVYWQGTTRITTVTPTPALLTEQPPQPQTTFTLPTTEFIVDTVSELAVAPAVILRQFEWLPAPANQRTVRLELEGSYLSLQQFTTELAERLPAMRLTSLQISARENQLQLRLIAHFEATQHALDSPFVIPTIAANADPFRELSSLAASLPSTPCQEPNFPSLPALASSLAPWPIQFVGHWQSHQEPPTAVVTTTHGQLFTLQQGQFVAHAEVVRITAQELRLREWIETTPNCWSSRELHLPLTPITGEKT